MAGDLSDAVQVLRSSRRVLVFTGAGVSAESGIPTFRDDDGFWRRFPIDQYGTWRGLVRAAIREPRRLAEFVRCVLKPIAEADPNAAHQAIAAAEPMVERLTIVTQNVDALHQRAGSSNVLEVHGTLYARTGLSAGWREQLSREQLLQVCRRLERSRRGLAPLLRLLFAVRPLLGIGWRGTYRPSVVMFGDALAEPAWALAQEATEYCDCFIQVGASGAVYPAATLPEAARSAGANAIAIDPEPTFADIWLRGTACAMVPRLFDGAFGGDRRLS